MAQFCHADIPGIRGQRTIGNSHANSPSHAHSDWNDYANDDAAHPNGGVDDHSDRYGDNHHNDDGNDRSDAGHAYRDVDADCHVDADDHTNTHSDAVPLPA